MNNTYIIGDRLYKCPLMLSHSVFMGKWKGMIIWALLEHQVLRYSQLKKGISELAKVSDKMLIESLKELETDGIILRKSYDVIPPKVEYSLTEKGRRLRKIWDLLLEFGNEYKAIE